MAWVNGHHPQPQAGLTDMCGVSDSIDGFDSTH